MNWLSPSTYNCHRPTGKLRQQRFLFRSLRLIVQPPAFRRSAAATGVRVFFAHSEPVLFFLLFSRCTVAGLAVPSERARHPVFDPGRDEETKEPPIPNIHNEIHGCKEIAARRAGRRIENMRKKYSRDSRVPAFLNFTYCRENRRLATETTPAKFLFAGGR